MDLKEIDTVFTKILKQMPQHWFSEMNAGVRVMAPISYALRQAFLAEYGCGETPSELIKIFPRHIWIEQMEWTPTLLPIYEREKKLYFIELERLKKEDKINKK